MKTASNGLCPELSTCKSVLLTLEVSNYRNETFKEYSNGHPNGDFIRQPYNLKFKNKYFGFSFKQSTPSNSSSPLYKNLNNFSQDKKLAIDICSNTNDDYTCNCFNQMNRKNIKENT